MLVLDLEEKKKKSPPNHMDLCRIWTWWSLWFPSNSDYSTALNSAPQNWSSFFQSLSKPPHEQSHLFNVLIINIKGHESLGLEMGLLSHYEWGGAARINSDLGVNMGSGFLNVRFSAAAKDIFVPWLYFCFAIMCLTSGWHSENFRGKNV